MSASIKWRPAITDNKNISVGAPSSFIAAMTETVGFPATLTAEDLPVILGMAAVYSGEPNPYKQIAELIENHGSIEIWAEY